MSTQLTPHQILSLARMEVIRRAPYFRAGVLALVPREVSGLGTFASTKNWIMMWDPDMATKWDVQGTTAVLLHELFHLVRDHFERFNRPLINQDLANIATDLSINPNISEMGLKLPDGGLYPSRFNLPDKLTAEEYYDKLSKMDLEYVYVDCSLGDGPGEADDGMDGKDAQGKKTRIKIHGCGSCSGRPRKDEPTEDDADGRSEAEQRRVRITIAKEIKQRGRGWCPGDLDRWADGILAPPKVDWREKLRRLCRSLVAHRPGSGHSTYTRPSRRQGGLGFGPGCPVLPSFRATQPRATFLLDSSGSMDQSSIQSAMNEASGVLKVCEAKMDVVVCDAAVHGYKSVRSIQEACKMIRGGGGSDFRPAFEEIEKRRPRTDIVIAATDGDITVPEKPPPGISVIWLLVQRGYRGYTPPTSWGTVIEVE